MGVTASGPSILTVLELSDFGLKHCGDELASYRWSVYGLLLKWHSLSGYCCLRHLASSVFSFGR